jgi:hypothetical protein
MSDQPAFEIRYADGSRLEIFEDGRAETVWKDGSHRAGVPCAITNRIPAMLAQAVQDALEREGIIDVVRLKKVEIQ